MFSLALCSLVPYSSNVSLFASCNIQMRLSTLLHRFNDRCQRPAKISQTVLCLWRQRRYPSCLRLFLCNYFVFPSPSKYSFTIFTTTPDNKNTAIRFGITISPLNVSAMFHISPRFMVAPTIATNAYKIMNGLFARVPNKNSIHLVP